MSIEEKAKAYDSIIEKANKMHSENCDACKVCIEELIPELVESEDERIRKWCISHFKECINVIKDNDEYKEYLSNKVIAWLEKQGEHANFINKIQIGDKVTRNEDGVLVNLSQLNRVAKKDEKQGEQKSIEPTDLKTWKYIVDAVLTRWNGIGQYLDNPYTEEIAIKLRERFCGIEKEIVDSRISNSRNGKEYGEALHNLDIVATLVSNWKDEPSRITEDGKLIMDNDAVELLIKTNRSFRSFDIADWEQAYQKGLKNGEIYGRNKTMKELEQKPAEDVNLPEFESYLCLMLQKFRTKGMCTNGEIIDFVKEHSQKLRDILAKPAWSEEDENMYNDICSDIEKASNNTYMPELTNYYLKQLDWLKSLKERVQPQPNKEWSEEDEENFKKAIKVLKVTNFHHTADILQEMKYKLIPREETNNWKPSDEQMDALRYVTNFDYGGHKAILVSLYEQLKKLRGE